MPQRQLFLTPSVNIISYLRIYTYQMIRVYAIMFPWTCFTERIHEKSQKLDKLILLQLVFVSQQKE